MIILIFCGPFLLAKNRKSTPVSFPFSTYIKTQLEKEIKCFQSDNGREFDNEQFQSFYRNHGMSFRFSCPHTSSQNGKAKRKIRTINSLIRTLLAHLSMPPSFWNHALHMTTYLLNILPNKNLKHFSPTQILYFRDPSYAHLRVFSCLCFPLLPPTNNNKLQARSNPCVFLGYQQNHRGYKCYDLSSRKIILSRHVLFDETNFPFANASITFL